MTAPADAPIPTPRRGLWTRWIVEPVRRQLTQGVTPRKIALTLAVGSACGLFPVLGTATLVCGVAGLALGLNQAIIQGVNALCTLVYLPMILVFVRLGDRLAGGPPSPLNIRTMIDLFGHDPADFFRKFGITVLHAVLGWVAVAPVWIPLVYVAVLPALRSAAARMSRRA